MSPVTSTFVDVGDTRYARHSWRPSRGLQRVVWSSMKDRCCPERGRGCVRMGQCGYIKPCTNISVEKSAKGYIHSTTIERIQNPHSSNLGYRSVQTGSILV
jgi:hypothetical protein